MGTLVAGGMRQSVKSMEDKVDSSKLHLESALRSEMRKDFDTEFGKTTYSFSEREKIKGIVPITESSSVKCFYRKARTIPRKNN
jgi:hypothetical protein